MEDSPHITDEDIYNFLEKTDTEEDQNTYDLRVLSAMRDIDLVSESLENLTSTE